MSSPLAQPSAPLPHAPHFTLSELIDSRVAREYGLDNTPGPAVLANLLLLAQLVLEPLRQRFGPIKITSGYRSPELNWFVSLSRTSRHCQGLAADLRPLGPGRPLAPMALWASEHMPCNQIILYNPPLGWLHLDLDLGGATQARLYVNQAGVGPRRISREDLLRRYVAEYWREETTK